MQYISSEGLNRRNVKVSIRPRNKEKGMPLKGLQYKIIFKRYKKMLFKEIYVYQLKDKKLQLYTFCHIVQYPFLHLSGQVPLGGRIDGLMNLLPGIIQYKIFLFLLILVFRTSLFFSTFYIILLPSFYNILLPSIHILHIILLPSFYILPYLTPNLLHSILSYSHPSTFSFILLPSCYIILLPFFYILHYPNPILIHST